MSTTKRTLEERGWVVFPSVIDPHECRGFLGALEGIWSDLHEPPLYSRTDVRYGADVLVSAVGFTVHRLLERLPGTRDLLLPEPVLRAVESVVGAEFVLDLVSGVLSDTSRPFFFWHHHVGGILEARDYLTQAVRYPRFESNRAACLHLLSHAPRRRARCDARAPSSRYRCDGPAVRGHGWPLARAGDDPMPGGFGSPRGPEPLARRHADAWERTARVRRRLHRARGCGEPLRP